MKRPAHWAPSHCLGGWSDPPPKPPISSPSAIQAEMPREMVAEIEADLARAAAGVESSRAAAEQARVGSGDDESEDEDEEDDEDEDEDSGEDEGDEEEDDEEEDETPPAKATPAAAAAKGPTLTPAKVEQLCGWLAAHCGLDAATGTRYAAALVGEGVDRPNDLGELDDGDWPAAIKPLHLKKIKVS